VRDQTPTVIWGKERTLRVESVWRRTAHTVICEAALNAALFTYNGAAACYGARLGATERGRLDDFLALHAVLTAPYVGRKGYHYSWPLRPHPRGTS
jgi:hypothetical protein